MFRDQSSMFSDSGLSFVTDVMDETEKKKIFTEHGVVFDLKDE